MLLGMALYKWGFLDGRRRSADYALVAADLPAAGPGTRLVRHRGARARSFAMPERTVADLWNYVGSVLVSVGYAAVLILIVKRRCSRQLRRALAAVGQMAFSNYLLQSVVTSILFLGWGFGLAGRFATTRSSFSSSLRDLDLSS